jgi:hypothetical protein
MGSAPVGATLSGIVTELIGPLATTFICAASMLVLVSVLIATTPVWRIMRHEDEPQ